MIDQDSSGLISRAEFKRFLTSLNVKLSEKEAETLCTQFQSASETGLISLESFKAKFWEA